MVNIEVWAVSSTTVRIHQIPPESFFYFMTRKSDTPEKKTIA